MVESIVMEREFLTLDIWDQLNARECEEVAQTLARCLPPPWRLGDIPVHRMGTQQRRVAFFHWLDELFALIPGGEITLGYDRDHPFQPDETQHDSWVQAEEAFGIDLHSYLARHLTPLRRVVLDPFLMGVYPGKIFRKATHGQALELWTGEGFRPPTSDEWEHARAGGSRSLFPWGNHVPGEPEGPGGKCIPKTVWLDGNSFGLFLAPEAEFCVEPNILRGGDGSSGGCGGMGLFANWVPLAAAFHHTVANPERTWHGIRVRKTYPLERYVD